MTQPSPFSTPSSSASSSASSPRPRAIVADDEPQLARTLVALLAEVWPALDVVHVARHGLDAARAIAEHAPEVAFLDIRMPGLSGLEVAQGIEGPTRVVFVTAYDEHAVSAFEHEALDYVLKPVSRERLMRTVQRLRRALGGKFGGEIGGEIGGEPAGAVADALREATEGTAPAADEDARLLAALKRLLPAATPVPSAEPLRWIRAGAGDVVHQVSVAEVLYFRADDKYTCVRTTAGAEHLIRTPIHELAAQLDPRRFVQVHRSTIVNLDHLAGTRRDEASRLFLRLRGSAEELPVSRAYVHLFKAM